MKDKNSKSYIILSGCLSYVELCYIDDALRNYEPNYTISDHDKKMIDNLKEKIISARSYLHLKNKSDN